MFGDSNAARLNAASGLADQIPLVAEDFSQWVVEDRFVDGRPALHEVGVQFSDEVKLWEQVKVRVRQRPRNPGRPPSTCMNVSAPTGTRTQTVRILSPPI